MTTKGSPHLAMPTLAERRNNQVERSTNHLISAVHNAYEPIDQQSPEDRAVRRSALHQAVSKALWTALSFTPNREERKLLRNQDHHDLLDIIARNCCNLAVAAADDAFSTAINVNLLTGIHSSSQGLNWQDHLQETPLAQVNITLTAIEGAIHTGRKTLNAALSASIETLRSAFINTSPHYGEFRDALEAERTTYNAALSQARDKVARVREENLKELRALMPKAGQPD